MDARATQPRLPDVFVRQAGPSAENYDAGRRFFMRLNDAERLRLTSDLVGAWLNRDPVDDDAIGGALREAWDSEPYVDGMRCGSYLSALTHATPDEVNWSMAEVALDHAEYMMDGDERRRLEELDFPLQVFRGGVGDPRTVAMGISWSTDIDVARFYSKEWPARWGIAGKSVVIAMVVERRDVAAIFDGRNEHEVILPFGGSTEAPLDLR